MMKIHSIVFIATGFIMACSTSSNQPSSKEDTETARLGEEDTASDSDGRTDTVSQPMASTDTDTRGDTAGEVDTGNESTGGTANGTDTGEPLDTATSTHDGAPTDSGAVGGTDSAMPDDTDTTDPEPEPVQTGLLFIEVDCDESVMDDSARRCDNAPVPCIPDEPKIICGFRVTDADGLVLYDSFAAIERRGRTSLQYDKPSYALELRDASDAEQPVTFLGMGRESDWILDASWFDRSFMRNPLTFDLFRCLGGKGHYAPEGRYATLALNGEAQGIYRLTERIKKDDDRIDISDDDGTGESFVVKQDDEEVFYETSIPSMYRYNEWRLVYPNLDQATDDQLAGIRQWMEGWSDAFNSDAPEEIFEYLDMTTAADFTLIQELSKNIDGYKLSLHLFKDLAEKAHFVPWDIDLGYGQPVFTEGEGDPENPEPTGWIVDRTGLIDGMSEVPEFRELLAARWAALRQDRLSNEAITALIDEYQALLTEEVIAANFAIWPLENVDFSHLYPPYTNYEVDSYADEVAHFRGWVEARLDWMDAHIAEYPDRTD